MENAITDSAESKRGRKEASKEDRLANVLKKENEFLDFIAALPAMSSDSVKMALRKEQTETPHEVQTGGLEHLEQLHRLMEHLGQLKRQNSKLQKRVLYLESVGSVSSDKPEEEEKESVARNKRSVKSKSSYYGNRSIVRSTRERSKSLAAPSSRELKAMSNLGKSQVSKWTKVKEAFKWEKTSENLPEAKSEDSGISTGEDVKLLKVPHSNSDHSSVSVSPADSVLSGHFSYDPTTSDFICNHRAWSSSGEEFEHEPSNLDSKDVKGHHCDHILSDLMSGVQRSKSLDSEHIREVVANFDESICDKDESNNSRIEPHQKVHKTPWGKVKGIIQTRKGSLKKKKSNHEDSPAVLDSDEDPTSIPAIEIPCIECSEKGPNLIYSNPGLKESRELEDASYKTDPLEGSINKRRLFAPLLTLTLPSTEELRAGSSVSPLFSKCPTPQTAQTGKSRDSFAFRDIDQQLAMFEGRESAQPSSRLSKWSKVKNAFLTSTMPASSELQVSCSVPSSPSRVSSFIYDLEPEDLEAGDSSEETRNKSDEVFMEDSQSDIEKTYRQLQMKLSAEFSKKLNEWERLKSLGATQNYPLTAGRTVANIGDLNGTSCPRQKPDSWETRSCSQIAQMSQASREALALQQLGEENLSADFKKKLEEWEKLKHVSSDSPTSGSPSSRQLHFRKKIADWQRWMPGGSSKFEGGAHVTHVSNSSSELSDDFVRRDYESRLEDRLHSPKLGQKDLDSLSDKKKRFGRAVRSSDSPTSMRNKWDEVTHGYVKNHFSGKSNQQGVKELAWLEKELNKIEREKQRLEKEKEKYEERLARLEKMKNAIGLDIRKKEVLIPTSTGLFRFQGISHKFTRKLYEWENARGIRPEASTFALLQPGYRPALKRNGLNKEGEVTLSRSRSMGSVTDLSSADPNQPGMTHQPSSLSLNDMDDLSESELPEDSRLSDSADEEIPEALIVEVEDVIEETAAALANSSIVVPHTPIYRYTPQEITSLSCRTLEDSREYPAEDSLNESSYQLLERNIHLLDQLESEQGICRELEDKMEDVNEQMNLIMKTKEEQADNLERANESAREDYSLRDDEHINGIKRSIRELERHHEMLRQEGENLQSDLSGRNEQQATIAQDLVGTVKRLQLINNDRNFREPDRLNEIGKVHNLSSQLLIMAERLQTLMGNKMEEIATEEESKEIMQLPFQLTQKIMELKQALNACDRYPDLTNHTSSPSEEVTSFTVKFPRRKVNDHLAKQISYSEASDLSRPGTPTTVVTLPPPHFDRKEQNETENDEEYPILIAEKREADVTDSKSSVKSIKIGSSPKKKLVRNKSFKRKTSQCREVCDSNSRSNPIESSQSCEEIGNSSRKFGASPFGSKNGSTLKIKKERRVVKSRRELDLSQLCRDEESEIPIGALSESKFGSSLSMKDPKDVDARTIADDYNNNDLNTFLKSDKECFLDQFVPLDLDDCCVGQELNQSTVASVFVPTKRKIFSPLSKDSNGKTASVISYEIQEPSSEPATPLPQVDESSSEINLASSDDMISQNSSRPDYVIPPCWILRKTKSQPASPAFPRKKLSFDQSSEVGSPRSKRAAKSPPCQVAHPRALKKSNSDEERTLDFDNLRKEVELSMTGRTTVNDIGFPPMSPLSSRREIKLNSKETAPSIRMMIARYNQKVHDSAPKSAEIRSGQASPTWRSPVAQRRVLSQVEGYQDELCKGSLGKRSDNSPFEVKKSASAGVIKFKENGQPWSSETETASELPASESWRTQMSSGVLKSFSEGLIEPSYQRQETESCSFQQPPDKVSERRTKTTENEVTVPEIKLTISHSKTVSVMPTYSSYVASKSHELHRNSSRAMKLQKAKEEFLSRGSTTDSRATSECGTSSNTPSLSISSECDWCREDSISSRKTELISRQSCGSESSCGDDSMMILGDDQKSLGIDRSILVKSASAGMIAANFNESSNPSCNNQGSHVLQKPSKFGFSSIASKFRKVKMRRQKEPETPSSHLDTVSALCRQSLVVDVSPASQASSSKSCPSSPVLQRPDKPETSISGPSSWIHIPGKRKAKPKMNDLNT